MPTLTQYPTTDTAVSGSWTSPTNVQMDDGAVASTSLTAGTSAIREQGGYGFDSQLPATAIITSVTLEVERRVTNTTGSNTLGVRARVSGTDLTEQTDATEPTSLTAKSYDITSLRAWTRSDLLDANFTTRISGTKAGTPSTTGYEWDYVRVVVTYATAGPRSIGTSAGATSGNVTPGMPTGWQPDDVLILVVGANDNVVCSVPAGWTKFAELNNNTAERLTLAWRRAVAGDTAPTVTHSAGGGIVAQIAAYLGGMTTGTPVDFPGSGFPQANAVSTTVTTNDFTPVAADEPVLFVACDNQGATTSGYSGTNPTFTERIDVVRSGVDAGGFNASIHLADGWKTDTSAAGARTATLSTSANSIGALFGIKPASNAALTLGASAAASTTSLALTAPATLPTGASDAASTTTLAVSAATQVTLDPSDAVAVTDFAVTTPGPANMPLHASAATAGPTLALHAPTLVALDTADGTSVGALTLSAKVMLALDAANVVATALFRFVILPPETTLVSLVDARTTVATVSRTEVVRATITETV